MERLPSKPAKRLANRSTGEEKRNKWVLGETTSGTHCPDCTSPGSASCHAVVGTKAEALSEAGPRWQGQDHWQLEGHGQAEV